MNVPRKRHSKYRLRPQIWDFRKDQGDDEGKGQTT